MSNHARRRGGHRVVDECVLCGRDLFCCERITYGSGPLEFFVAHEGCAMPVRAMHPEVEHVDLDELLRGRAS